MIISRLVRFLTGGLTPPVKLTSIKKPVKIRVRLGKSLNIRNILKLC